MSRIRLVAALVAIVATAGGAAWWWVGRGDPRAAPLSALGPVRIDFPPVVRGEAGELVQLHDFRFRSTAARPLRVAAVTASCACTLATAEPSDVPPGGELVVHTVTTLEEAGSRHATVWVRLDDGRGVEMRVSAELQRPVVLSTVPMYPRPGEDADELDFTLVWTGTAQAEDPGLPEFAADRGEIETAFGPWQARAVDSGGFGPGGPPVGARALAGSVRVRRAGDRWPAILTVRIAGADPLRIQLRDLLPGE